MFPGKEERMTLNTINWFIAWLQKKSPASSMKKFKSQSFNPFCLSIGDIVGHAARRSGWGFTNDLLLPIPPRTWQRGIWGQLKTWVTTIKADLKPLSGPRVFGYAQWWKSLVGSHRAVEPEVPPSRTWSFRLVLPTQPGPGEWCHK